MTFWVKRSCIRKNLFLSFNPCSIGMTFWVELKKSNLPLMSLFQSLFYWNDLLSCLAIGQLARWNAVSILVLLEWPSEFDPCRAMSTPTASFNPCSIGMTFWVIIWHPRPFRSKCPVSILVLLEWPSESRSPLTRPFRVIGVSILVLLEWPSELMLSVPAVNHRPCFNPCSIGMTFWVQNESAPKTHKFMFQSLFYWNDLLSNIISLGGGVQSTSFNPCSIGMTFWVARSFPECRYTHPVFQSLFYWNDLLSRGAQVARWWSRQCFNPCSIGMTFWVNKQDEEGDETDEVSILVLLEWPSESWTRGSHTLRPQCFNPCSIGMTFWVQPCFFSCVCFFVVSILVLLEWPSE